MTDLKPIPLNALVMFLEFQWIVIFFRKCKNLLHMVLF